MWQLYYKESWALKNWSFWTVVLEKTVESPLDCKETKLVNPKGNQLWILIGKADVKHSSNTWASDVKSQLIGKDPDAGKGWGQEKGVTEDKVVEWYHRHNGRGSEQTPGDGKGQGSLACCSPWGHKESDMTEWLNWKILKEDNSESLWRTEKIKLKGTLILLSNATFP